MRGARREAEKLSVLQAARGEFGSNVQRYAGRAARRFGSAVPAHMLTSARRTAAAVTALVVCGVGASEARAQSWTTLVSSTSSGAAGDAGSRFAALSADGAWCAFSSAANDLAAGDTNLAEDVFVRARGGASAERVSVASGGVEANGASFFAALSADGRFVTFQSYANNLVFGDTNGRVDCFVRDRLAGLTERVSVSSSGAQGTHPPTFLQPFERLQAISGDGRFVAFVSLHGDLVPGDTNSTYDIFVRDRAQQTTARVNLGAGGVQANAMSWQPAISSDGRFVAFASGASNLVAGDANNASDVFVVNRLSGALELVSVALGGGVGQLGAGRPALSADGRFVAFVGLSGDYVALDTNGVDDAFVRDRLAGATERVSIETGGAESLGPTSAVALSADGRFALFTCVSDLLAPGDADQRYDLFLRDRLARTTTLVSLDESDANRAIHAEHGELSADASVAAFHAIGPYVAADVNFDYDVFARDLVQHGPSSYCAALPSTGGCLARCFASGDASLSSPTPLRIDLSSAANHKSAAFFYGLGRASAPYLGGLLCVAPPLRRTPLVSTAGSLPPLSDCSGAASYDLEARIAAGVDPALVVGAELFLQWFVRDPQAPLGSASFSDALFLRLVP